MYKMLLYLVMLLSLHSYSFAEDMSLRFGLFPYVNPAKLIEHHKSFVEHLEMATGRKIQLLTSPDYKTFLQRTRDNEFDIILTAPHFGRLAEVESAYQRIAMTTHMVQGIFLVNSNSRIKNLTGLKEKRITIAAPTSIIYRLAEHQLRDDHGLVNGKNIEIVTTGTHNNSMYAVIKGESEAAVTGIKLFQGLQKKSGPIVRKIGKTKPIPGFMLLANKNVPKPLVLKLRKSALSFSSLQKGEKYIFRGYKKINDHTMRMLDAYTNDLQ